MRMTNGEQTAVCVISGHTVRFTSVRYTNSEAVLRERDIVPNDFADVVRSGVLVIVLSLSSAQRYPRQAA